MNYFKKIFLRVKEFFFPGACALCGSSLTEVTDISCSLCINCRSSITLFQGNKCCLCGKPLISEIGKCISCRDKETSYERLWVFFPYIGKYRELLTAYKFNKNLALAGFFAEKVMEVISGIPDAVIVPVPPRPGKIKENGWDQVEYLVKQLEKIPGCPPVCRCLKRRKSKVQKQLSRTERLENLKGRIYLNKTAAAKYLDTGQVFIVIDDVITTGSTIEVCSAVLKEGGVQTVYGLCLFYD